jgi:hypothetical protein
MTFCAGWVAGFSKSKESRLIQQGYAESVPDGARALKRAPTQAVTVECVVDPEEMQSAPKGAVLAQAPEKKSKQTNTKEE